MHLHVKGDTNIGNDNKNKMTRSAMKLAMGRWSGQTTWHAKINTIIGFRLFRTSLALLSKQAVILRGLSWRAKAAARRPSKAVKN